MTAMFFEAQLIARRQLTPGMIRLTFTGPDFADFPGTGVPDEYLRLFFPNPDTGKLHLPIITEDGRWTYPDGQEAILYSTYTIRAHRPDQPEIDIDFVVHEGGRASDWAQHSPIGSTITINRPRGLYTPPRDYTWQLLVADATGLPAIARILEQTPANVKTRAYIEVAEPSHEQELAAHPQTTLTWLHKSGNGIAPSRLADLVRAATLPAGPGYIWVAGEQKVVRTIRKYVRQDLKLTPDRYELVSYWTHEGEAWKARWNALPEAVRNAIDNSWSSGRDPEQVRDEYYATLEKYGL